MEQAQKESKRFLDGPQNIYDGEIDMANYAKKIFSMFTGEEESITIQFANSLVGVLIDRFGQDVFIEKADEIHFIARVNVVVSPAFLSWIFQFDDKAAILSPQSVIDKMKNMLLTLTDVYNCTDRFIGQDICYSKAKAFFVLAII